MLYRNSIVLARHVLVLTINKTIARTFLTNTLNIIRGLFKIHDILITFSFISKIRKYLKVIVFNITSKLNSFFILIMGFGKYNKERRSHY